MKYYKIIIVIVTLCFSCDRKQGIELSILNESLVSYIPKDTIHRRITIKKKQYQDLANNKLKFKLENKSNQVYMLVFSNETKNYFPSDFMSLGLNNLVFTDEDGNSPNYSNTSANADVLFYHQKTYQDSIVKEFYDNIGYKNKSDSWKSKSAEISKSILVIHPNEVVYFETYSYLPNHWNSITGDYGGVNFEYNKKYTAKLQFSLHSYEDVDEYLTDLQKKEIKENNYKVYDGELISINKVPVDFVE
ncbi:hypothetical protein [uncultured Psychroserpens sp.]|uniref:hypothetical protein n=1 Tax=uncultured Psychroserpens sp. TaxID=255436 RepID=UPI00263278F7|nr:hypothetical protein [uncultured Psychroserpens sp.]